MITMLTVGSRYLDTVKLPVLRGRGLTDSDGVPGREAVIINQRLAALHFPNEDPIGKTIRLTELAPSNPPTGWATIVDILPNVRQRFQFGNAQPQEPPARSRDLPAGAGQSELRARHLAAGPRPGRPGEAHGANREEIRVLDPDLPVFGVRTVDEFLANQRWPFRVFGMTFAIFAAIAMLLSAIGLYRGHCLFRHAADARDRRPHGAGSPPTGRLVDDRTTGIDTTGAWAGHWTDSGGGCGPVAAERARGDQRDGRTDPPDDQRDHDRRGRRCLPQPVQRATRLNPVIALRYE